MNNNHLLNITLKTILKKYRESIKNEKVGLWCFRYIFDKRSLITWDFIPIEEIKLNQSTQDLIKGVEIPEGHGSIGYMMLKKEPVVIPDTLADPRSMVSEIDDAIQQKSALCYPIIKDDNIIIVLDFFSSQEKFFNDDYFKIITDIVENHKDLLSSLYFFSLDEDLVNIYSQDIKIPKRDIGESIDDFVSKCNQEFLLKFLSIVNKQARVPILELQTKDEQNVYKQEKLLFNPEELRKILLQEFLLCNYKSRWFKECVIINGNSDKDCDCCQPPLDTIIEHFLNLKEDTIRKEFPTGKQNNSNYRMVIFSKRTSTDFSELDRTVEELVNTFIKSLNYDNQKDVKVKSDRLQNRLNNEIYYNLTKDFKNNIKCILLFIKSPKVYRFEKDIRSIQGLKFLRSNVAYLNQSTIGALTASLVDPEVLNEYPPNFITHDGVSVDLQNGTHKISIGENNKVDLKWEEKTDHKDLFHIYISEKFIKEVIKDGASNDDLKNKVVNYFNLLENNFKIEGTNAKVIIYSPYEINKESQEKFRQYLTNLYNYYETAISRERTLKSAVKSAIAAIMSRNGSHNLGSHVLSSVSQNLNELSDDRFLFTYIQQRMDFIAQITTEIPEWYYPCSFVQDLMRRFYMQRHLLTYICGAEGLKGFDYQKNGKANEELVQNNIIIKVLKREKDKSVEIIGPDTNKEQKITELTQVAIPGGIVGQHAFYTILENFLRNTAKHSWAEFKGGKKPKNLEVYIEYNDDPNKDYVVINIWDNVSIVYDSDIDETKKKELADKLRIEEEFKEYKNKALHFKINSIFKEHFIQPSTGKLRNENWGLAEMKICAAYLNKIDITEIGLDDSNILFDEEGCQKHGIIRAKAKKDKDDYRLCYEFAIPKPKELLLTGINNEELLGLEDKARKYNVYLYDKLPKQIDHELIVFLDPSEINFDDIYNLELFPFKLILLCEKNDTELSNKDKIEELINKRRLVWIKNSYDNLKKAINNDKKDKEVFWNKLKLELNRLWLINYYEDVINGLDKETFLTIQTIIRNGSSGGSSISEESLKKFLEARGISLQKYQEIAKKLLAKYEEYIETLPVNLKAFNDANIAQEETPSIELTKEKIMIIQKEPEKIQNSGIQYTRHMTGFNKSYIYQESLSGSQIYYNLFSVKDKYFENKLTLMLLENAFLRIGIADERFINYFYNNVNDRQKYIYGNIIPIFNFKYDSLPVKQLISQQAIDAEPKRIRSRYVDISTVYDFKTGNKKFDVFIIHQTILDEYFNNDTKKMQSFANDLKQKNILFVVTSGRGKPDKLPDNVKFLPFSNLESFLLKKYPEKFLLTMLLMFLKRKKG